MTKGYCQIPMRERDIAKISIVTPEGRYEFLKMPFGLMNSGATFTSNDEEVAGRCKKCTALH